MVFWIYLSNSLLFLQMTNIQSLVFRQNFRNRYNHIFTSTIENKSEKIKLDTSGVKFNRNDSLSGNSIVASKSLKQGDVLITLPLSLCILANRNGEIRGLQGQTDWLWEICGDLRNDISESDELKGRSWDIQLALALLDASAGTG